MTETERRARAVADEMAAQMAAALGQATPEELGWRGLTREELIASEWKSSFEEEMRRRLARGSSAGPGTGLRLCRREALEGAALGEIRGLHA
jgi:hypothetical protein